MEEIIGKAEIVLGKEILKDNLQKEIAISPKDTKLNKSKVTLCCDGGWDQRALGKAYNSASGCFVGVGGRANKVCTLVYYSKR